MKKKPAPRVKVSAGSLSCSIYSTTKTICPMCQAIVPAKTQHSCGGGSTKALVNAIAEALS